MNLEGATTKEQTMVRARRLWIFVLACTISLCLAKDAGGQNAAGNSDAQIQADVTKALDNSRFKDVKIAVQDGQVTLSGTVELYSEKEDADKRAHHRKNVKGVQNLIEVAGPTVEDATLRDKLAEKL